MKWLARVSIVCAALASFGSLAEAQDSTIIPLHPFVKKGDENPSTGKFYYVDVAIGSPTAPSNSVLVDTGSTGLYILQTALNSSSYTLTGSQFTYSYSSGNVISGTIAFANVYFPGATDASGAVLGTPTAIAFGVTQTFTCGQAVGGGQCAGYRSTGNDNNLYLSGMTVQTGWNANQTGVMGVGFYPQTQVFNPLTQLAGNYASGFIFSANAATGNSNPVLVVGLTAENTAGYNFVNMQSLGATGGMPGQNLQAWNTKIPGCFTTNGSTGCFATIFDSGAGTATFMTAAVGGSSATPNPNAYPTGPLTIGVQNVMSFSSTVVNDAYEQAHGQPLGYNASNTPFLYYTVAYDYWNGRIGFSPASMIAAGTIGNPTIFQNDAQLGLPGGSVIVIGPMQLGPGFVSSRAFNLMQSSYNAQYGEPTLLIDGSAVLNGSLSSGDFPGSEPDVGVTFTGVRSSNTLTLNGISLFSSTLPISVSDLKLVVNGILPGAVSLGSGATLGGNGLITGSLAVGSGATVAPGNSIGTLTVSGDVTFQPGSTYSVEVGSPGSSDQLAVFGSVALDGPALTLTPYAGTNPALGYYPIIAATNGVSGSFSSISAPAFGSLGGQYPFISPTLVYTSSAVVLDMVRSNVSYTTAAQTTNQYAVATIADRLAWSNPVNVALSDLNASTAPAAFDSLSGQAYASVQTGLQQQSTYLRDATTARVRQAFAKDGEPAAAAASTKTAELVPGLALTAWAQAYGGWGQTEGDGNAASLSRSIGGFLMGIDSPLGEAWRVGLLGGYSQSTFNVDGVNSSADSDNYDLGLYGGARFGDFGLRFGAGYTWHDLSMNRSLAFGGMSEALSSNYQAGTAQVFGEAGYGFHFGATTAEPFADLAYVNLKTDGFTETGGAAALSGDGETFDTTYSVLGLRLGHGIPVATGGVLMLTGSLGWQHAYGGLTPTQTAFFAGSDSFTTSGVPIARDTALIDVGFGYNPTPNIDVGLHYDGAFASSAQDSAIKGTLKIRF